MNREPKPLPDQSKPHPDQGLFQMNREPEPLLPDVERMIRENKYLIRKVIWWRWAQVWVMAIGVLVGIWPLYREASDWLFGRTLSFSFDGTHAPHYSRAEFEREFTKRAANEGFTVKQMRITRQTTLNQFYGEITLIRVPSSVSNHDVSDRLRKICGSMKDRVLPVETPIGPE